jgi:mediator of RNA polymerase II transcription subunit 28
VLTKEEALPTMEKDEIRVEVDHTILRFIDLARQMEAFFLQKRFLLSALKPELVVKEVNTAEMLIVILRDRVCSIV